MSTIGTGTPLPVFEVRTDATSVEARLMHCFDAAADDPEGDEELRRAAADYGRSARSHGLLPEQLVIALKETLCCHGDFAAIPSLQEDWRAGRGAFGYTKYARVLRWCIQAYYDE